MTSQIVSATIDESFPVAGQDNDSQGFRDNFNITKTGLATAAAEITALQTSAAKLDEDNDFHGSVIANAQTNRLYGTVYTTTTNSGITAIDFNNGEYQVVTLTSHSSLRFENWPNPETNVYSKIRVGIKTDGNGDWTATFITQGGVLTPLRGASNVYSTGTNPALLQLVDVWTSDNGDTVYLALVGDFSTYTTISDIGSIGNVRISDPTTGQVLKYDGLNWLNADLSVIPVDLSDLTDTTNLIPVDLSDLTDTTNLIPVDLSDLTDTTGLVNANVADWSGSEDLVEAGSANLTVTASYFSTIAPEVSTLAAGVEGQIKVFAMNAYAGDMVITVANPGWGGAGTITFNAAGQACTLQYFNSKWFCVGNNGATFA